MPSEVSKNEEILKPIKEKLELSTTSSIQISHALDDNTIVYTREADRGRRMHVTLKGLIVNYFDAASRRIEMAHITRADTADKGEEYWLEEINRATNLKGKAPPALEKLPILLTEIVEAVEKDAPERESRDRISRKFISSTEPAFTATKEWMGELFDEALARFDKPLFPARGRTGRSI